VRLIPVPGPAELAAEPVIAAQLLELLSAIPAGSHFTFHLSPTIANRTVATHLLATISLRSDEYVFMVGNQICGRSGGKIASQDGSGREISSGPCPDTPVFEFTHRGSQVQILHRPPPRRETQNTQCSLAMDGFAGLAASKFRRCDKIQQCQAILRNDIAGLSERRTNTKTPESSRREYITWFEGPGRRS
jgi:hypothetical protein